MGNENSMKNVMDNFMALYAQRDKNMQFNDWLGDVIMQQFPDMSESDSRNLAGEIINGVAEYDKTLAEIDSAFDEGLSKEEWFAEKMAEEYSDMPIEEAGEKLDKLSASYDEMTVPIISELDEENEYSLSVPKKSSVEWNEYNVKDAVRNIGKKAVFAVVGVAASAVKRKIEQGEETDTYGAIGEALQDGIETDPSEVKAAVAGAVKVAAMKGLEKALPEDVSTDVVCGMAGVAVEGAEALIDVANGKATMNEAVDRMGRAGVAAGCKMGAAALKGYVLTLPFGGLITDLLGGLFKHMESEKFANNVYTVVRDTAVATWEGIKNSNIVKTARSMLEAAKDKIKQTVFVN